MKFEQLERRDLMTGLFCHVPLTDAIPISDFNGDGYDDLAVAGNHYSIGVFYGGEDGLSFDSADWIEFIDTSTIEIRIHHGIGLDSWGGNSSFAADVVEGTLSFDWVEHDLAFYYGDDGPESYPRVAKNYHQAPAGPDPTYGHDDNDWYFNESDFNGDGVQDMVRQTNIGGELTIDIVYRKHTDRQDRWG